MDFIRGRTKTNSIVASVLTGLALITLIMLSTLLNITSTTRTIMCLIYTVALLLILCIWEGILEINVFADYKMQRKYLCADGIVSICMGVLLVICSILFGALQAVPIIKGSGLVTTDIRIFLSVFLFIMAIWKGVVLILSIKEKRFNWWYELVNTLLWLALAIICSVSMVLKNLNVIAWLTVSFGWALIAINIVGVLISYVIKSPQYLETERAKKIVEEEIQKVELHKTQISSAKISTNSVESKLKKLKELKDQKLISEEEYKNKKKDLLDSSF